MISQRNPVDDEPMGGAIISPTTVNTSHTGRLSKDEAALAAATAQRSIVRESDATHHHLPISPSSKTSGPALVGGAISRKPLGSAIDSGIPVEDERYVTGTSISSARGWPLAKGKGWPLVEEMPDPPGTRYVKGVANNVYDGPLAAEMASRFAEPDKYSSTIHIHREPIKYNPRKFIFSKKFSSYKANI